ncbi:MAG: hypothetical protein FJ279_12860 [Planctomycetes bacterium]|nr:hypothetical protein [Planctomycetota bacterium]
MKLTRRTFLGWLTASTASIPSLREAQAVSEKGEERLKALLQTKDFAEFEAVWQEMTGHASGERKNARAYDALKPRMEEALSRLTGQMGKLGFGKKTIQALERLCRDRYEHIERAFYPSATCYKMTMLGNAVAITREQLEKQYHALRDLASRGKLPPEVVEKAERLTAQRAEFLLQAREVWESPDKEEAGKSAQQLAEFFERKTGELKPEFKALERSTELARLVVALSE